MELILRNASIDDSYFIWQLSNEESVRSASFSSDTISWEKHKIWFQKQMNDPNSVVYIAENDDGNKIGQCRFFIKNNDAVISVSIVKSERKKGFGHKMIFHGLELFYASYKCKRVMAHIKPENEASIRMFSKSGFDVLSENNDEIVMFKLNTYDTE